MTEQEALSFIRSIPSKIWEQLQPCDNEAVQMAIKALEEIQQYREIGTIKEIKIREAQFARLAEGYLNDLTLLREYQTIGTAEEFKALKEKGAAKKVKKQENNILIAEGWEYGCPSCGCGIGANRKYSGFTQEDEYCPTCGQKLDWEGGE